jgi:drug/metabolite transporter (DMT)-like permease
MLQPEIPGNVGAGRLFNRITPKMRRQLTGFALASGGMLLLSCNYITAKTAMQGFNPKTFAALWYIVATGYSLVLTFALGQGSQLKIRGKELRLMLWLGITLTLSALFGWAGLSKMDPTFNAFLGRLTPMMTILLGVVLLKEHVRPLEWLAVAVMVGGGVLSTMGGTWQAEWWAIVLTLAASFCTALQFTLGKFGGDKHIPPLVMNVYRTAVAAIAITVVTLAIGEFDLAMAEPRHWGALLLGALLGPCLSVTLIYDSYRYWEMTRTAMVLTLQPLAVLPMAYVIFHDIPGGWKLIGGLIILAGGLWLVALHRPPHNKSALPDGGRDADGPERTSHLPIHPPSSEIIK